MLWGQLVNRVLVYGMVGTNRGGIETFLLKMNQYMTDTVFDYVIEEESCLHKAVIEERGGKVYYITKRTKSPLKNLDDNRILLRQLHGQIDAVYFNLSSLSWIEPIKIAIREGYKVLVHSHNSQFIEANSTALHKIANFLNKNRLSSWNVTRLTCSKPAANFLFKPKDKVIMIYNAINIDDFIFKITVRNDIREKLAAKKKTIIGFVGRLGDQKNPLYLVDIMRAVTSRIQDVMMIVIGEGPFRSELENKISSFGLENQVIFLGNISNVNEYMQAMDVFVLPSFHEGLPYVVVEAQAAGLKCLVSDRVTEEVNVTGNVKFLSLTEDAENWGDEIIRITKEKNNNRIDSGFYMRKTEFNIFSQAKKLEDILTHHSEDE